MPKLNSSVRKEVERCWEIGTAAKTFIPPWVTSLHQETDVHGNIDVDSIEPVVDHVNVGVETVEPDDDHVNVNAETIVDVETIGRTC